MCGGGASYGGVSSPSSVASESASTTITDAGETAVETVEEVGDTYQDKGYIDYGSLFGNVTTPSLTIDVPTLDEVKDKVSDSTPTIKIDTDNVTTLGEITDVVSDSTPDLIIDTSGLTNLTENIATGITDTSAVVGETLGGITTDILQGDLGTVLTDAGNTIGDFLTNPLGTTQEILDHNLGDTGLKGAIDQTVEFVQNPGKVINKAKDRAEDFIEGTKEEVTGTVKDYKEVITDIGETAEEIGEVATETLTTGMETVAQLGDNAATQVTEAKEDLLNALVEAGLLTRRPPEEEGVGNAQAIMAGDPRMLSLMARRNLARKRGKAQLRKGGGLYIPVGTGLQVPA